MTDDTDLLLKLREPASFARDFINDWAAQRRLAADAIERLTGEVSELNDHLRWYKEELSKSAESAKRDALEAAAKVAKNYYDKIMAIVKKNGPEMITLGHPQITALAIYEAIRALSPAPAPESVDYSALTREEIEYVDPECEELFKRSRPAPEVKP